MANTKGWINVAPFTSDTEFDPEKSQSAKVWPKLDTEKNGVMVT